MSVRYGEDTRPAMRNCIYSSLPRNGIFRRAVMCDSSRSHWRWLCVYLKSRNVRMLFHPPRISLSTDSRDNRALPRDEFAIPFVLSAIFNDSSNHEKLIKNQSVLPPLFFSFLLIDTREESNRELSINKRKNLVASGRRDCPSIDARIPHRCAGNLGWR